MFRYNQNYNQNGSNMSLDHQRYKKTEIVVLYREDWMKTVQSAFYYTLCFANSEMINKSLKTL